MADSCSDRSLSLRKRATSVSTACLEWVSGSAARSASMTAGGASDCSSRVSPAPGTAAGTAPLPLDGSSIEVSFWCRTGGRLTSGTHRRLAAARQRHTPRSAARNSEMASTTSGRRLLASVTIALSMAFNPRNIPACRHCWRAASVGSATRTASSRHPSVVTGAAYVPCRFRESITAKGTSILTISWAIHAASSGSSSCSKDTS